MRMVSAWPTGQRIVLGQQACEEKSNEITAIPLLLKNLDPAGALVTIDAIGTETKIAQTIRDGGGDYVLSLKENWPATYAEVVMLFNNPALSTVFESARNSNATDATVGSRSDATPFVMMLTG